MKPFNLLVDAARAVIAADRSGQLTDELINQLAEALEPAVSNAQIYGPFAVVFLGAGVWAGIPSELPPELVGRDVWLCTSPHPHPAPQATWKAEDQVAEVGIYDCGIAYGTKTIKWSVPFDQIAIGTKLYTR